MIKMTEAIEKVVEMQKEHSGRLIPMLLSRVVSPIGSFYDAGHTVLEYKEKLNSVKYKALAAGLLLVGAAVDFTMAKELTEYVIQSEIPHSTTNNGIMASIYLGTKVLNTYFNESLRVGKRMDDALKEEN